MGNTRFWTKSCVDSGTRGPVPGIVGTLQAAEAIKIILDIGKVLNKELLIYDMLTSDLYRFSLWDKTNSV